MRYKYVRTGNEKKTIATLTQQLNATQTVAGAHSFGKKLIAAIDDDPKRKKRRSRGVKPATRAKGSFLVKIWERVATPITALMAEGTETAKHEKVTIRKSMSPLMCSPKLDQIVGSEWIIASHLKSGQKQRGIVTRRGA